MVVNTAEADLKWLKMYRVIVLILFLMEYLVEKLLYGKFFLVLYAYSVQSKFAILLFTKDTKMVNCKSKEG
jgi:hypothetical protein